MKCRVRGWFRGTVRDLLSLQVQVENAELQRTLTNQAEHTAKEQNCKDGGKQGTREGSEKRHPAWTHPLPWLRDRKHASLWGT